MANYHTLIGTNIHPKKRQFKSPKSKTNLEKIGDERCDEHVVQPIVLVVEDIFEAAAAAERHQDADVAGLDAGSEKRDEVVVTQFTHLTEVI